MSSEYKKGPHTVYDIQYHLVWATKYRYNHLAKQIQLNRRFKGQIKRIKIRIITIKMRPLSLT